MTAIALTIAGSDSSGGAGIQADLKTFSALGVFGCSVITALTAQNTRAVTDVLAATPEFVRTQIDTVFDDLAVDAVKIGMLGDVSIIEAVAERLDHWKPRWIVLDPVMVAKSGDKLLAENAIEALKTKLLPRASIITPNLPEAAALLNESSIEHRADMPQVAARLQGIGSNAVLLKGGHLKGEQSPDLLMDGGHLAWLEAAKTVTRNTHGTGCTLSSAITALLAKGMPLPAAVAEAKNYVSKAILAAEQLQIGSGHGPVHHFHNLWPKLESNK